MTETFADISLDEFLGGQIRLYQPSKGFRAGQDSVIVASAVPLKSGDSVLDVGAGAGTVSLCLLKREKGCSVTAVELQSAYADLLKQSATLNGMAGNIDVKIGDIHQLSLTITDNSFDQIVMNPPFFDPEGTRAPDEGRALARHADQDLPQSWIRIARRLLRPRGYLTLIYSAAFLPDILQELKRGFGGVTIIPVYPSPGKASKRILVRARKNVKTPFTLHQGLFLRHSDGTPTDIAMAITRDGLSLDQAFQQFDDK